MTPYASPRTRAARPANSSIFIDVFFPKQAQYQGFPINTSAISN